MMRGVGPSPGQSGIKQRCFAPDSNRLRNGSENGAPTAQKVLNYLRLQECQRKLGLILPRKQNDGLKPVQQK